MIHDYVHEIASQMQIQLSHVLMVEGSNVGCLDAHLLSLTYNDHQQSVLVYQSELDKIQIGLRCEQLEFRVRAALSHLHTKLKP